VEAYAASFLDPPPDIGQFDLVVLSHVLEHVLDVRGALDALRTLVKHGGLAYIEVPDAARYADYLVAPFNDFNTEHINHFSGSSLSQALKRHGFEPLTVAQKDVLCSPVDPYPAVFGLFRRTGGTAEHALEVQRDEQLAPSIRRYVERSEALLDLMTRRVLDHVRGRPVVVWGAGQLAMKLLAGPLSGLDVLALVDTSEPKWGQRFDDLVVEGPGGLDHLDLSDTPIVVTSVHHQESIVRAIAERFPGAPIVTLRPSA
jgi:hypothetical protein